MMAGRRWTCDEEQVLRQMREAGVAFSAIGRHLDRTDEACSVRAAKLGITAPEGASARNRIAVLEKSRAKSLEGLRRWAKTDAAKACFRERAYKSKPWLYSKTRLSPEAAKLGRDSGRRARWDRFFADIPTHLLSHFRSLKKRNGYSDAEARQMIADEWVKQLRRALRQIAEVAKPLAEEQRRHHNSLEGQIERIKAGTARVVPTFKPGRMVSDDRSLIGNSSAMAAA